MNKTSSIQCLYKYLPMNYAEGLLYKGVVHFRQAAYFLNLEGDAARGDKHDGARIVNAPTVIGASSDEGTRIGKWYTVRSQEELKTSYIFCTAKSLRADLFSGFQADSCVVIKDANEFKKRILSKAGCIKLHLGNKAYSPRTQKSKGIRIGMSYQTNIMSDDVIYFDDLKTEETIVLRVDTKEKFFHKRRSLYEWENEFRFLIEPKGKISLFSASNEDAEILKNFLEHHSFADIFPVSINVIIGNIEDIAEIRMAKDL